MAENLIQVTLYDKDNAIKGRYARSIVHWGLLKKAYRMFQKFGEMDPENFSEEQIDSVSELVVQAFDGQFTVQDLDEGCDIEEMVAVVAVIVDKANRAFGMLNPTMPGRPTKANRR